MSNRDGMANPQLMEVLQVTNTYYPELKFGGPPMKVHALSKRLAERGHSVRVLTFDSQNSRGSEKRTIDGVAIEYVPWRGWGLRQWAVDKQKIADAIGNSDVVHCYGLYNFLCPSAARIARQKKRHYVVEPLGMYQPRARNILAKRIYHRFFTRQMFRNAARVIATSPVEFEELKGVIPDKQLVLRRNGINLEEFQELPSGNNFRRKYTIPANARVILFLGRISPIKNLEMLVRAFEKLALPNCRLVLAGPENEPNYSSRLRGLIQALGLEQTVLLPGALFDADKLSAFAAAELFVLPSLSESFGNAAAEAVATGVPVLLTNTCGAAPLIHQRAGLAVSTDSDSLRAGLQTMLDPNRREAFLGDRTSVVNGLSWDEPVQQMEALYQSIGAVN